MRKLVEEDRREQRPLAYRPSPAKVGEGFCVLQFRSDR